MPTVRTMFLVTAARSGNARAWLPRYFNSPVHGPWPGLRASYRESMEIKLPCER
jgi:hypothetical protein